MTVYYRIKTAGGLYYGISLYTNHRPFTSCVAAAAAYATKTWAVGYLKFLRSYGHDVHLVKVTTRPKTKTLHEELSVLIAKAIDLPPNPEVSAIIEVLIQLEQGAKEARV